MQERETKRCKKWLSEYKRKMRLLSKNREENMTITDKRMLSVMKKKKKVEERKMMREKCKMEFSRTSVIFEHIQCCADAHTYARNISIDLAKWMKITKQD